MSNICQFTNNQSCKEQFTRLQKIDIIKCTQQQFTNDNQTKEIVTQNKVQIKTQSKSKVISTLLARIVYSIRLMRSKKWYNYFYLTLTIIFMSCLMLENDDPNNYISNISKKAQYCCHCIFILFVFMRLMSFEPIHLGWCCAECIAFVTGLSTIFVKDKQIIPYLHAASCLRLIIIVRTTQLFQPFLSFIGAFKNVARVVLPALILIYLFAVTGLFAFFSPHGSIKLDIKQKQIMTYQNIVYSIYNTYKIVFIANWSSIANIQKQSTNQIFVFCYYVLFLYFVSYIYMNIFYGTMMANEKQLIPQLTKISFNLKSEHFIMLNDEFHEKNKKKNRVAKFCVFNQTAKQIKQLMYALIQNSSLKKQIILVVVQQPIICGFLYDNNDSNINKLSNFNPSQTNIIFLKKNQHLPENPFIKNIIQKLCKFYNRFDMVIIIISCLNLCISTKSFSLQSIPIRHKIDLICTYWIFFNLIIKLFCYYIKQTQLKKWSKRHTVRIPEYLIQFDFYLKFQIVIAVIAATGLLYQSINNDGNLFPDYPQYDKIGKFFRTIKYIRICQLLFDESDLLTMKKLKIIILSVIKVIKKILPYFIYFFLMVIIFSLIGYNLFKHGDQSTFNYQFSTVFNSCIFVFMMFNNQLPPQTIPYQQYPLHGVILLVYNIIVLTIGNAILQKYFMTLLLTELLDKLDSIHKSIENQQRQQRLSTTTTSMCQISTLSTQNNNQCKLQDHKHIQNYSYPICQNSQDHLISIQSQSFINRIKKKGLILLSSGYFFWFHLLVTAISVIQVAHRGPLLARQSIKFYVFQKVQIICSIYFIIQLLTYLFCCGVFHKENSFFKKYKTGILTLIITIICSLSLFSLNQHEIIYKLCKLKVLRMFITLQLFSQRSYRMKLTLIGFIRLLPKIMIFLGVVSVYYGFFAVVMVSLYQNQNSYCVNYPQNVIINDINDCFHWGGDWVENALGNNYSLSSMIDLIIVSLIGGWNDYIARVSQIRGINLQAQTEANNQISLLMVYGSLTGSFLILNLYTGFLLYYMNKITREVSGQCHLDKFQQNWLCIRDEIRHIRLNPIIEFPKHSFRDLCHTVFHSRVYKIFKIFYICSLLLFLSLPAEQSIIQFNINFFKIYACYFATSMIFTIFQLLGKKTKIHSVTIGLNVVLYVYAIAYFGYIFTNLSNTISKNQMILGSILTALQLCQHWQYFTQFSLVHKTLKYLYVILPRVVFILISMLIVMLSYTFIALELFAYLRINDDPVLPPFRYTTFFQALESIVRFTTEADINQIINSSKPFSPDFICFSVSTYQEYLQYGANACGSKLFSYIFFISFHIIYNLTLNSVLMENIFDSYIEVKKQENILINQFELEKVTQQWMKFDKQATGFLPYQNFLTFTSQLHSIYKINKKQQLTIDLQYKFLQKLNINLYKSQQTFGFQFYETIQQLTRFLLCKKYDKQFQQNNADIIFQRINGFKNHGMEKISFTSKDVIALIALKKGLKIWHRKAKTDDGDQYMKIRKIKIRSKFRNY